LFVLLFHVWAKPVVGFPYNLEYRQHATTHGYLTWLLATEIGIYHFAHPLTTAELSEHYTVAIPQLPEFSKIVA
jgi:hypothetical protein